MEQQLKTTPEKLQEGTFYRSKGLQKGGFNNTSYILIGTFLFYSMIVYKVTGVTITLFIILIPSAIALAALLKYWWNNRNFVNSTDPQLKITKEGVLFKDRRSGITKTYSWNQLSSIDISGGGRRSSTYLFLKDKEGFQGSVDIDSLDDPNDEIVKLVLLYGEKYKLFEERKKRQPFMIIGMIFFIIFAFCIVMLSLR